MARHLQSLQQPEYVEETIIRHGPQLFESGAALCKVLHLLVSEPDSLHILNTGARRSKIWLVTWVMSTLHFFAMSSTLIFS